MKKTAVDPRDTALCPEGIPQGRIGGLGTGPEIDDLQAKRPRGEKGQMRSDLPTVGWTDRRAFGVGQIRGTVPAVRFHGGLPFRSERVSGESEEEPEE